MGSITTSVFHTPTCIHAADPLSHLGPLDSDEEGKGGGKGSSLHACNMTTTRPRARKREDHVFSFPLDMEIKSDACAHVQKHHIPKRPCGMDVTFGTQKALLKEGPSEREKGERGKGRKDAHQEKERGFSSLSLPPFPSSSPSSHMPLPSCSDLGSMRERYTHQVEIGDKREGEDR